MAANLQSRGLVSLGKRVVNQISYASARTSANSPSLTGRWGLGNGTSVHVSTAMINNLLVAQKHELTVRRGVQTSVYDKNPEDHVRDSVVPDEVIETKSDKYWAPHPQTGVFGPAATDTTGGFHSSPAAAAGSILEQKTFFRPLEDLEKPPPV